MDQTEVADIIIIFFAKYHHAGTASSQCPIGLSPVLTASLAPTLIKHT